MHIHSIWRLGTPYIYMSLVLILEPSWIWMGRWPQQPHYAVVCHSGGTHNAKKIPKSLADKSSGNIRKTAIICKTALIKTQAHLFRREIKWTKSDNGWLLVIDKIYHHNLIGLISTKYRSNAKWCDRHGGVFYLTCLVVLLCHHVMQACKKVTIEKVDFFLFNSNLLYVWCVFKSYNTTSGKIIQFTPRRQMIPSEFLFRALTCLFYMIEVSHRYNNL